MNIIQALPVILVPGIVSGLSAWLAGNWAEKQIRLAIIPPDIPGTDKTASTPKQDQASVAMERMRPFIEEQVDRFMNERLQELFPLLVKFMGDKTKMQFRQAFLEETERLFPEVISRYQQECAVQEETGSGDSYQADRFIHHTCQMAFISLYPSLNRKIVIFLSLTGVLAGIFVFLILCLTGY